MKRAIRLLQIIDLLKARGYTSRELAERFDVSQRTIQQDLAELQADPLYAPLVTRRRQEWMMMDVLADGETCA